MFISRVRFLLVFLFLSVFFAHVQIVSAQDASNMEAEGYEAAFEEADRVAEKFIDIKSAALNYYTQNSNWPADIEDLITESYYFGTFDTTYGTVIGGVDNGTNYELTLVAPDSTIASYLASMLNGTSDDSDVSVAFGLPSQAAIVDSVLSRVWDGDAERNTMETAILMGGNDISGAGDISAAAVTADTVSAVNGVYDGGTRVFSPINLPDKSDVGLGNVQNYVISDDYTGGSSTIYASQKAITDAYQGVMQRIDDLDKSDVGLGNVQNFGVSDSYTGGSASLYASQKAVTDAYSALMTAIDSLTKADVGLGNVQNYSISNDYTGGSAGVYASQKAVTDAYKELIDAIAVVEDTYLKKTEKAADSQLLDGIDSSQFIRSDSDSVVAANTRWGDGKAVQFGDDSDLLLNHSGNHGYIENYTGDLYIRSLANGGDISLVGRDGSGNSHEAIRVLGGSSVVIPVLNYNGETRLHTTQSGVYVTGTMNAKDGFFVDGSKLNKSHIGLGNVNNWAASSGFTGGSPTVYATQKAVTDAYNTLNSAKLGVNDKAADAQKLDGIDSSQFIRSDVFDRVGAATRWLDGKEVQLGDDADLRIRHDGSNSYFTNYTGALNFQSYADGGEIVFRSRTVNGEYYEGMRVTSGTDVRALLSYDGGKRLETRSTGVDVYGSVNAASGYKVDGTALNKSHIGLDNVNNWSASSSFTGGSPTVYATQKAVTDAYNALNSSKLGVNDKAADAQKLDGLDSSQFIRADAFDYVSAATRWGDGKQVQLGDDSDLRLSHTNGSSFMDNYTGQYYVRNLGADGDIIFQVRDGSNTVKDIFRLVTSGSNSYPSLRYNNSERLRTTQSGVYVTGTMNAVDGYYVNGSKLNKSHIGLGNVNNWSASSSFTGGNASVYATQKAVTDAYNTLNSAKLGVNDKAADAQKLDGIDSSQFIRADVYDYVSAPTRWGDSKEVQIGDSADLRISHDGSNSYLRNYTGALNVYNYADGGEIVFRSRTVNGDYYEGLRVTSDSEVRTVLSHNGNKRLETRNAGVDVYGTVNAVGGYKVNGTTLNKSHIGLGNVNNWSASSSYTGGSAGVYATQKAVTDAYNALNSSKLGTSGKAADADKLDGLNSSQFIRSDVNATVQAWTRWMDGKDIQVGDSADLRLRHVNGNSYIDNYTGQYVLRNVGANGDMIFKVVDSSNSEKEVFRLVTTGSNSYPSLRYNNTEKLRTTNSGVYISGTVNAVDGYYVNGSKLDKGDIGLSNVQNYGVSNSYTGGSATTYASQKAITDAYNALMTSIKAIDKSDVGLGNVNNWGATSSYSGNSSTTYATQKAVYDAYQNLNAKVNDLDKSDVGLGNVQNYGVSNSYKGGSATIYASQKAVTDAYNALNAAKLDKNGTIENASKLDGIDSSQFLRSDSYDEVSASTRWKDNTELQVGNSADLRLSHVNGNSYIRNYTGSFNIVSAASGGDIVVAAVNGGGTSYEAMRVVADSSNVAVQLKYNGGVRVQTTNDGANVYGYLNASKGFKINGTVLNKNHVGLGSVMNYGVSNSYTGGNSNLYASQKAVTDAYNALNAAKLGINDKAADAQKLDGLDSTAFVRTSRKVNGKALTADITLGKSDVGLGNVNNWGATSSFTSGSASTYATQKAVYDAYRNLNDKIVDIQDWREACIEDPMQSDCGLNIEGFTYGSNSNGTYFCNKATGYTIQTGRKTGTGSSLTARSVSYPISFTKVLSIQTTGKGRTGGSGNAHFYIGEEGTRYAGFVVGSIEPGSTGFTWVAIGESTCS